MRNARLSLPAGMCYNNLRNLKHCLKGSNAAPFQRAERTGNSMHTIHTNSVQETEAAGRAFATRLHGGCVVALFGGMGMGKTAFVRGLAQGLGIDAEVTSPTFALVHEYGGSPPLCHFDMYRVNSWDGLYSTGFFDYLDAGGILAVEWSENIEGALPEDAIRVSFQRGAFESERIITIERGGESA